MINKTRVLYIVIAILVVVNAVSLTAIFLHKKNGNHGPGKAQEWLARQLNLTPVQLEQYHVLVKQHHNNIEPLLQQDRTLHDNYFKLLQQPLPDSTIVNRFADSIADNRKQTELATFYHFMQIRALCNAEQQSTFDKVIGKALHMPPPGPAAHSR